MGSPRHILSCLSYCWKVKQIIFMVTCTSVFLFLTFMSSYISIVIVPNKKPYTVLRRVISFQFTKISNVGVFSLKVFDIDFECEDRIFIDFFHIKKSFVFSSSKRKSLRQTLVIAIWFVDPIFSLYEQSYWNIYYFI